MTTTREYKGYIGSVESDMVRMVNRGKILFVNDLITFEAGDLKTLQIEFESAVDDYLETCRQLKRSPQKPLSGQFNVRIEPELHQAVSMLAARKGTTLNGMVVQALKACVAKAEACGPDVEVLHKHTHTVTVNSEPSLGVLVQASGGEQKWLN